MRIESGNPDTVSVPDGVRNLLTFGKYKGKHLDEVPVSYLHWLINPQVWEKTKGTKSFSLYSVPPEIKEEAQRLINYWRYPQDRLAGMSSEKTDYIVELLGDLARDSEEDGRKDIQSFSSLEEALLYIRNEIKWADPEDDRILVWEVLPSGHKKVMWHFSGWHWNADEFHELDQGVLPGDEQPFYTRMLRDDSL